jgi:hypothetical protein
MWPSFVFNTPGQSNLMFREVRLLTNTFVTEYPTVNLSILVATETPLVNTTILVANETPLVNMAIFAELWVGTVRSIPPQQELKVSGAPPFQALQIGPPNGDALANGAQVVFSVPFETQARKYPLLPENLAL